MGVMVFCRIQPRHQWGPARRKHGEQILSPQFLPADHVPASLRVKPSKETQVIEYLEVLIYLLYREQNHKGLFVLWDSLQIHQQNTNSITLHRALYHIFECYFPDLRALPCIYPLHPKRNLPIKQTNATIPFLQIWNLKFTEVKWFICNDLSSLVPEPRLQFRF